MKFLIFSVESKIVSSLSQDNEYPEHEGSPVIEEELEGYEYTADVRAWETFSNILRRYGIALHEGGGRRVTFSSKKRLDLKGMKEKGLLRSYAVANVKRVKELLEVG
jgi:hypothetical protein